MKKHKLIIGVLLFFLITPFVLNAAYLRYEPMELKQPDGNIIKCFASGDEYYNWCHDADGFTIIQNHSNGYWVFGDLVNGDVVPTNFRADKYKGAETGVKKWAIASPEKRSQLRKEYLKKFRVENKNTQNKTQVSRTGTIQNLVIFIRFSGESEFADNISTYTGMFNASSGSSMYAYYQEVSQNTLNITSTFYPTPSSTVISYQDSHDRNYYSPYDPTTNPTGYADSNRWSREVNLVANCINSVKSQISGSLNIDNDNDTYVDNLVFVISGSPGAWASILWPHMTSTGGGTITTINTKKVDRYNFQIRSHLLTNSVGVLCHEMFHTLGAPDLYHYSYDGLHPAGSWDIMEYNANPPQHMSVYMKQKYGGWIASIPTISNGNYSLNPSSAASGNCYRINSPNSSSEYYVVEFRKKTGTFENSVPASGMLIWRVNTAASGNADGPPDEVYCYRPGGTPSADGTVNNAYFSSEAGRTAINSGTDPAPFLQDGSAGGLTISNIGSSAGTTISFTIGTGLDKPILTAPAKGATAQSLKPTFSWNAVTGATSYDFQVCASSNFASNVIDQTGMTATTFATVNALNNGVLYFWRVRAVAGSNKGDWSDTLYFTTLLQKPVATYPLSGAKNVSVIDSMQWNIVSGADTYDMQISETTNFSSPVLSLTSLPQNYAQLLGRIQNNKQYYWRIKAYTTSPYNESIWSDTLSFWSILPTPILSTPLNDAFQIKPSDTLIWQSVTGATSYTLYVATTSDFVSPVINASGLTLTKYPFLNFTYNTKYYWKVEADNANSSSKWSTVYNFTTMLKNPTLITPDSNAKQFPSVGTLKWNKPSGTTKFWVQVSAAQDFVNKVFEQPALNDSTVELSGLNGKTQYFWRVMAKSATNSSDWTSKWSFTTKMATPTIPVPLDSSKNQPLLGQLIWNAVNGATSYHVQMSTRIDFSGTPLFDSTVAATSLFYPKLDSNKIYYWHINASDGTENSGWSKTWYFITYLKAPSLVSPSNNAVGIAENGDLRWNTSLLADAYHVQLADNAGFTNPLVDQNMLSDTLKGYTNLTKNTKYYWRIAAIYAGSQGDWSSVYTFITNAGQPTLLAPANNANNQPVSGTVTWNSLTGATSYTLQISKDQSFGTTVVNQAGINATSYNYSNFDNNSTYYWRVNALANGQTTAWSEQRTFVTTLSTPTLSGPTNDAKCQPLSGTLSWTQVTGADSYNLIVSTKSDLSTKTIDKTGLSGTSYNYTDLLNNTKYYWSVSASNTSGTGQKPPAFAFTTLIGTTSLTGPADKATERPQFDTLNWSLVPGATKYHIQFAKDQNFAGTLIVNDSNKTSNSQIVGKLDSKTTYYWRARALSTDCQSDWTGANSFTTANFVGVDDLYDGISRVYPNPVSNMLSVEYNSQESADISFMLYNQLGENLLNISDKAVAGKNRFSLSIGSVPDGSYNLLIKTASYSRVFHLTVIK